MHLLTPKGVKDLLAEYDSFHDGHFVFTNGGHSQFYINCAGTLRYPTPAMQLGYSLGKGFLSAGVDVIVAPAFGAVNLLVPATRILEFEGRNSDVCGIIAEKVTTPNGEKKFGFSRGADQLLDGKRIGIAEDLWSSGSSTKAVADAIRLHGGLVVAAGAIVNRGNVTAANIGDVEHFFSLCEVDGVPYEPDNCPLCKERVPMRVDLGHGKKWIEQHPDYPVAA